MSHSTQHYRAHSLSVRIPAIARAFHAEFFRALHTARQLLLRQRCCSRHHALAGALRPRTVRAAAQRAVYTPPLRFNSARAFSYIDVDVHHGDGVEFRLSHTTAACYRCHFTGTARDSSLEQAICHKLTRAMTMQMKMVSASGDLHPQLSCKVLRFDDALEIQSTGEMCWLHPQLLAGICTCPDTPAACHSLNVPYRRGLSDASFMHLFLSIFPAVVEAFWFVFLRRISFRAFPDLSSVPRPSCCN